MYGIMLEQETEELKAKQTKEPAASGAGAKIDPATELPPPDEPLAELEAPGQGPSDSPTEAEQLKAERDRLLDRLARLQAEFENARKRAEREKAEFRDHVAGSVVEQFLPVLDNFELALKSTGSVEQLRCGVSLIVKQMEEILEKMQVKAIPAVGEAFDPRVHEALGTVERDDMPDHHVAEEIRRGYKIREKLLRPAMVRVANNSKQVND
jgi:molecular chaperone GrpE